MIDPTRERTIAALEDAQRVIEGLCAGKSVRDVDETLHAIRSFIGASQARSATAAQEGSLPLEGWRLVPIAPTAEMWTAWQSTRSNEGGWRAMLAAAPQPEERDAHQGAVADERYHAERGDGPANRYCIVDTATGDRFGAWVLTEDDADDLIERLRAAHPPTADALEQAAQVGDGEVTAETAREQESLFNMVHTVWFRAGLLACREYMARFVEAQSPSIAQSIRANWWPSLGEDFGPPRAQVDFNELMEGGEDGPWTLKAFISPTLEALPIAWRFLDLRGATSSPLPPITNAATERVPEEPAGSSQDDGPEHSRIDGEVRYAPDAARIPDVDSGQDRWGQSGQQADLSGTLPIATNP